MSLRAARAREAAGQAAGRVPTTPRPSASPRGAARGSAACFAATVWAPLACYSVGPRGLGRGRVVSKRLARAGGGRLEQRRPRGGGPPDLLHSATGHAGATACV